MICMKLVVVAVIGAYSLPYSHTVSLAREAEAAFARAGICVDVVRVQKARDRHPGFSRLNQRTARWYRWQTAPVVRRNRGSNVHFVFPPMVEPNGTRWMAGAANNCKYRDGTSWSSGQLYNDRGEPRRYQSLVAMTHEVAHLAGADHDNSGCNVMHEGALSCGNVSIDFRPPAINEMRRCREDWM